MNRNHFVESECLNEVQSAAENNRFFRVRRTCTKALEQVSSDLFELNEKLQRRKRKLARRKTIAEKRENSLHNGNGNGAAMTSAHSNNTSMANINSSRPVTNEREIVNIAQ